MPAFSAEKRCMQNLKKCSGHEIHPSFAPCDLPAVAAHANCLFLNAVPTYTKNAESLPEQELQVSRMVQKQDGFQGH